MKISLKHLQNALVEKLNVGLAAYGFTFNRKRGFYEKSMPGLSWAFNPGFIKHESDFDVIASVSARLDNLEKLVYEEDEARSLCSYSIGGDLGNISEGRQKRWTITSQEDVDLVSQSILDAFAEIGIPYLKKYSVMGNALIAFSGDDKAAWIHCPVDVMRAKRALGLAFLLKKRNEFSKLAEQKALYLETREDPKLKDFLDFKQKCEKRVSSN